MKSGIGFNSKGQLLKNMAKCGRALAQMESKHPEPVPAVSDFNKTSIATI